jgi:hypothetical protein
MSRVPLSELQELAAGVSMRAHLRDVRLSSCQVTSGDEGRYSDLYVLTDVATSAKQQEDGMVVMSHYRVRAIPWYPSDGPEEAEEAAEDDEDLMFDPSDVSDEPDLEPDADPAWEIRASFVADHSVRRVPEGEAVTFTDDQLKAYSLVTGAMSIHPYAREFVQSMTTRLGYPAFTVPLMRRVAGSGGRPDLIVDLDDPGGLLMRFPNTGD